MVAQKLSVPGLSYPKEAHVFLSLVSTGIYLLNMDLQLIVDTAFPSGKLASIGETLFQLQSSNNFHVGSLLLSWCGRGLFCQSNGRSRFRIHLRVLFLSKWCVEDLVHFSSKQECCLAPLRQAWDISSSCSMIRQDMKKSQSDAMGFVRFPLSAQLYSFRQLVFSTLTLQDHKKKLGESTVSMITITPEHLRATGLWTPKSMSSAFHPMPPSGIPGSFLVTNFMDSSRSSCSLMEAAYVLINYVNNLFTTQHILGLFAGVFITIKRSVF